MNLNRNCECCGAAYISGKEYGYFWRELPLIDEKGFIIKAKGLCEFCNPKCEKWFIKDKKCHNAL